MLTLFSEYEYYINNMIAHNYAIQLPPKQNAKYLSVMNMLHMGPEILCSSTLVFNLIIT